MPSAADPLVQLAADRTQARELGDAWASLCTLGTVNAAGDAEQRTLVLRELDKRLALFFSASAPKWQELKRRPTCSLQLYLPSIQVQYRLRAGWQIIDPALVASSWILRPDIPKKLDWLYQQHPQSSPIDRTDLHQRLTGGGVPDAAPDTAMGIYLIPIQVERLQLRNQIHDRERWTQIADSHQFQDSQHAGGANSDGPNSDSQLFQDSQGSIGDIQQSTTGLWRHEYLVP